MTENTNQNQIYYIVLSENFINETNKECFNNAADFSEIVESCFMDIFIDISNKYPEEYIDAETINIYTNLLVNGTYIDNLYVFVKDKNINTYKLVSPDIKLLNSYELKVLHIINNDQGLNLKLPPIPQDNNDSIYKSNHILFSIIKDEVYTELAEYML